MESTRFTIDSLCLLAAAPLCVADVVAWVETCRTADGGYAARPGEAARMDAAYYALRVYASFAGRPPALDACQRWVAEQGAGGGFSATPGAQPDVDNTYYALRALELGGGRPGDDGSRHAAFLDACAAAAGGFGNRPGEPPDLDRTYCAIHSLLLCGRPVRDLARPAPHANWAAARMTASGGYANRPGQEASLPATYWAVHALCLLDEAPAGQRELAYIGRLREPGGGFCARPWEVAEAWPTYCALQAAALLGGRSV